ncbi:MAG TPA: multidrug transporter, partial [Spirochaetia bacterium]|nr:multidrug transporter [Spirochaetia bacterium]
MSISDISVKKPVTLLMLLSIVVIFGFISLSRLSVDLFPDLEIPIIAVITQYSGAGPKEVEKTITKLIESTVSGVNNIDHISSTSREGTSTVLINFKWGANIESLTGDIREKLDIIKDALPDDAGVPMLFKFSPSMMPIMMLGLKAAGDADMEALYNLADEKIKTKFEQVSGIANVSVIGGLKKQIHVDVSKNRLQAYGLDINRITQLLYGENQNQAGGNVYEGVFKYVVRTVGEFKNLEDIGNIIVTTTRNNIPVKLKDLAEIKYGYDEESGIIRINQEDGLLIQLFKETGLNTVQTAKGAKKQLQELRETLPPGLDFEILFDSSDDINRAINGVVDAALQGTFFAVLILMLFLWNIRTVLIIGISIPTSIIVTFIAMYALGVNLNMISLSGLALGVGMMVDCSIVVLENIFHYRIKGLGRFSSAAKGANEVALAVSASTITTIVIFVPFLIVEGLVKEIFWDLALTVSISLLASLIVSITLIPMLSSKMMSMEENRLFKPAEEWFKAFFESFEKKYENLLRRALANKKKIVIGTLVPTFVIGGLILAFIGKEGFPQNDQGEFILNAAFPPGTRIEYTEAMTKNMEKEIKEITGSTLKIMSVQIKGGGMFAAFMGSADYKASIRVKLVPVTQRKIKVNEVIEQVRQRMQKYPAKITVRNQGGMMFGNSGGMFAIEIRGDELDSANKLAEEIKGVLKTIKGIREPEIEKDDQLPEISLAINRDLASKVGINALTIANAVKTGFGGKVSTTMKNDNGSDIDIIVRFRPSDRVSIDDIMSLCLPAPSGQLVPLASIINSEKTFSPTGINRKDSKRIINVNADIYGRAVDKVVKDAKEAIDKNVFIPRGFDLVYGGSYKDMQESFSDLRMAFLLALVLVYAVMASQFESLLAPFVVMFCVPFGAVGALIMTFIAGKTFSIISACGIVILVGIVINNGIILVDYMNQLMKEKIKPDEA